MTEFTNDELSQIEDIVITKITLHVCDHCGVIDPLQGVCMQCGEELIEAVFIRQFPVADEDYNEEHEDDCEDDPRRNGAICDCYICVPAGDYPDICAHCGKMVRPVL